MGGMARIGRFACNTKGLEMIATGLEIEQRSTGDLIAYARNARTHSDAQVGQIAASIGEFGFNNPVLVDERGEIVAGHGRVLAAERLGLATVPAIVLAHLSEAQKRAYRIADNRIAESAGWDEALLREEFLELRDQDFDLSLSGFEHDELERLLADPVTEEEGEDEAPEPEEAAVTQPGDLWLLGRHRLLCGDATSLADVERVLGGEPATMCFTDPPYNVDYAGEVKAGGRGKKDRRILNDNLGSGFGAFLLAVCTNVLATTRGAVYVCMSSSELHTLQAAFVEAGGHWSTFVIWAKSSFTLGRSDYHRQYEPMLYGWKEGGEHHWCGDRGQGDVWHFDKPGRNPLHPTMKPVALVERAVRNSSRAGDVVLDPFGGSGTTAIAAEKAKRRARLLELEPRYCDVIVRRWEAWSGQDARLEADGRTFNEIAASVAPAASEGEAAAA